MKMRLHEVVRMSALLHLSSDAMDDDDGGGDGHNVDDDEHYD